MLKPVLKIKDENLKMMKYFYSSLTLLFLSTIVAAQSLNLEMLQYEGINFNSPKQKIVVGLGTPKKIYEPNYECGFISSEEQGKSFTTLAYPNIKFTGNEEENYIIDKVSFKGNSSVNYGDEKLNSRTDLNALRKIFGEEHFQNLDKNHSGGIVILTKNGEDGIRFQIENGHLVSLEYWSPC